MKKERESENLDKEKKKLMDEQDAAHFMYTQGSQMDPHYIVVERKESRSIKETF